MTIPPRFLDELRNRLSLSEIAGRRVKLERAGMNEFKACCPFHKEKSPSFTLNDAKQFYHCFGCGAHGDVIGFVMQHDNLTFIEAVEALAAQAGMAMPAPSPQERIEARRQKDLYGLLEDTALFFEACLREPAQRDALSYLHERGMGEEAMGAFRVGFAPADGQALRAHLREKGYEEEQMAEAGVVMPSSRGGAPYSFFRERIIFPVADRRGRVVAFGARILPDHLRPPDRDGRKPPKYINSPDSPLFHKGRMLYGESHARQAAADGQRLVVVEGYMDVIACFSAGFRGAVAPLGTALTEDQIAVLWKMIPGAEKNPVLCFDGDNAGRRAAARAAARILPLLKPDQSALYAFLPEGEDPDSIIRARGGEAFGRALDAAMPMADFLWAHHSAGRNFETPEALAGLEKILEEEALRIADRSVQQYYRRTFRERLYGLSAGRRQRPGGGKSRGAPAAVMPHRPLFSDDSLRPLILLALLINHPGLFEDVEEEAGTLVLPQERLDLLRQTVLHLLADQGGLDADALRGHLIERGFSAELGSVLSAAVYTHAGFARPGAAEEEARAGWRETRALMRKKEVRKEIGSAARKLAGDFSADNEKRVFALHHVHNEGDE